MIQHFHWHIAQAEGIFGSSDECAVLDLDGTGGKTFLRVLLHLAMHDYPPLVSGALKILFRHFSQRQEVLQAFKQVQLLVSDSDVKSYKQIKDDLDGLRLLVEKSELWVFKVGFMRRMLHYHVTYLFCHFTECSPRARRRKKQREKGDQRRATRMKEAQRRTRVQRTHVL